jgi:hypothetical protein
LATTQSEQSSLRLELGSNNFSVFADSVSVNVSVYARRCYVGLNSLKSLNMTNVYPNNNNKKNKKKNNKVKSKPLKLFELAGKKKSYSIRA